MEFDSLEWIHGTLAQEIIELIVRVRESTSDIEFITEETDQVARQFRQVTNQLQEGLIAHGTLCSSPNVAASRRAISVKYGKQASRLGRETLIDKVILEQPRPNDSFGEQFYYSWN